MTEHEERSSSLNSGHADHSKHANHTDHSEHSGHQASTGSDSHAGHVMDHGTSDADYWGVGLLVASFALAGLFAGRSKSKTSRWRFDLFKIWGVERAVKSPYFSFLFRLVPALIFVLVIVTGLFGRTRANFAAPFTWLFWWTLLVLFVAFGGKIFCAACPWDFFANLVQFGWFHRLKGRAQSFELKWPKRWTNIYLAVGLFIGLTWAELGLGVAYNSYATAWLGLAVVGLAIVFALTFEKRAFCRYACPVGRISGIYAKFSPIELRVKDPKVCVSCRTKDCVKGSVASTACPTGLVPFRLKENTYCTLCTECVRSCDKNNMTLRVRRPGVELEQSHRIRNDEVVLTFVILTLTFFHGLTMVPTWTVWMDFVQQSLGLGEVLSFSLLMLSLLGVSALAYRSFCLVVDQMTNKGDAITHEFIFSFIPLVLGYHVGHNAMHFLGEGAHLVPLINDPFGYGWDLFGWADFQPRALLGHVQTRWIQLFFVAIGFFFSVKVLRKRSVAVVADSKIDDLGRRVLFGSHYFLLFGIGLLGVWFIFQPMVMRSSY